MIRYLNLTEFADRLEIQRDTLAKYRLPEADAIIGDRRGWLESTIDLWNESRPGRGNWGSKAVHDANFPPPIRPGAYAKTDTKTDVDELPYPEFVSAFDQERFDRPSWQ